MSYAAAVGCLFLALPPLFIGAIAKTAGSEIFGRLFKYLFNLI